MSAGDDALKAKLIEDIAELTRYHDAAEGLANLVPVIELAVKAAKRLSDRDPELLPEIAHAAEHLNEAAQAIVRAHDFASARCSVRLGEDSEDSGRDR